MRLNPKDNVQTPTYIWKYIQDNFGDPFDPCPLNPCPTTDGLKTPWQELTYVNAPYSQQMAWTKKSYAEFRAGCTVVMLAKVGVVARAYFQPFAANAELLFINHKIQFPGFPQPARFASVLIVWKPNNPRKGKFSIIDGR
jgi:hypothetical protein